MKALAILLSVGIGFASASLLITRGYLGEPVAVATLVDGGTYTGKIEDGRLEGQGTVRWPGGDHYEGEFSGGVFDGDGEYTDAQGRRYRGSFERGQFSGHGTIYGEDGGVYVGETAEWRMHGQGEYRDGSLLYRGMFGRDKFSGRGELYEDEKLIYRGAFEDSLYHGEGEYFEPGGSWKGNFEYGAMTSGSHTSELGDHYEGAVQYQLFHGDGALKRANGDRYQGQFRYGEFHGNGTMYLDEAQNGVSEYSGMWRNGRLVVSEQSAFVENYEADLERALYSERSVLDQALAQVPAGDPGKAEIYFLGVAGDGTQRVFAREVTAIKNHFDELAPLGARQINLLNDRTRIGQQPMATLTSIARAIETIGQQMNVEQDLLVLYISSHGSEDHRISLKNEDLGIADLSADHLSALLQESGIRWQVIFVSACYSGGFISPLQSDSRLIMTASSAVETSFGCSDEAELTYFGQALLKSLPQSDDPEVVFRLLRMRIESREEAEGLNSSNPQFYLGNDMAEKLKAVPGIFNG